MKPLLSGCAQAWSVLPMARQISSSDHDLFAIVLCADGSIAHASELLEYWSI
uniref:Uncharacterized protein n=1 Tax=Arundo donax TaxID=35708 RepID=A0A0A9ET27_ARUDO